jgi:gamma-glutamylcyclotransferase
MSQICYFAYGSNMNEAHLSARLARFGETLLDRRPGILHGYRLTFNKVSSQHDHIGFANIEPADGSDVEGTLNAMHPHALDALDSIELVPHHYRRASVLVRDAATGRLTPAFTYVANPEMVRPNLKPTRDYLAHLLAAADVLPGAYLDRVRAVECWA